MADARSWWLVENTLLLIAGTLAISIPLGTALAVALYRTDIYFRRAAVAVLCLLLVVPLYLQAAAWQAGFGASGWFTLLTASPYQAGLLEGWRGAIWVHAVAAIPWVTMIVGASVRLVEPGLEELALLDGAPWQVFMRVTLRQALPTIGLSAVWVAIGVATEMTVTDLFQTGATRLRTYAEEIYTQFALGTDPGPPPTALVGVAVTSCLALFGVLLCMAVGRWRPQLSQRPLLVFRLGRWRGFASGLVGAGALGTVGVPLVSLIYKAGVTLTPAGNEISRGWSLVKCAESVAASPVRYDRELSWSLVIAVVAACSAMAVALPLGWLARRGPWGGLPALILAVAALSVPGPLIGMALIAVFNWPSLPALNVLYDRSIVVVSSAQAIRAFPVAMFIVWHALRSIPNELLDAAALDGAGRWTRFWRIAFPLRWPALAVAWLAAFVVAIGELSATIMVTPPGVDTLGTRVAQMLHFNIQNELAALSLFLFLAGGILLAIFFGIVRIAGRSRLVG
ncbi:MAG TPA: ABC transporter permease subunit [Pirellulales bacterium]|jgi:iron(III) transport system permease protein|nr:ABC transporter permease subunit [Pirellulales bacterium]